MCTSYLFQMCTHTMSCVHTHVLYSHTHTHTHTQAAYFAVRLLRLEFDIFSGYTWGKWFGTLDEKKWLTRIIFLETIAGVPGK